MQQLSGLDASFLYFETANAPMHIGGFAIYDQSSAPGGRVTFKGILANLEKRLHLARCFRQKLVRVPGDLDHPYWIEDPNFDLEFHARHIALPEPGDWRQLCIQVARIHARPLDLARPLWEMYVIEGLGRIAGMPTGSFAILTKVHHAAIDGVSGAELTAAIHDLTPDAEPSPPQKRWAPEAEPMALELLGRTVGHAIRQPFRLTRLVGLTLPAVARGVRLARREGVQAPGPVPRTRFNGTVSAHRVVEGRSFALDEIREIRKAVTGATVNDVVLAIVGGALRKYLQAKQELPPEPLVAMAPISVRTETERGSAGNRISAVAVSLRSDVADPLERLGKVCEGTRQSKQLTNAVGARLLTDYSQFIPGSVAGLAARLYSRLSLANRVSPIFNCVVTNVPGPQFPLYSMGARMVATFGCGPILDGMALIHPVFSYCGTITISVTSCREVMPDPGFYSRCLEDSFGELKTAALGSTSSA